MAATATTNPATNITSTAATLEGTVNPDGTQARAYFEYGPTTGYGHESTHVDVGDGTDPVDVAKRISSFSPNTTQHYRVVLNTDVVPPSAFGADLPDRIGSSSGATAHVETETELLDALGDVDNGDVISVDDDIVGSGGDLNISRAAVAGAPITITGSGSIRGYRQVYVTGRYLRFYQLPVHDNADANIKITGGAQYIEVDGCEIYNSGRQGILVTANAYAVQIWNNDIHDNGSPANGNLDHGIYFAYARGACVIGCNKVYNNAAYNIQYYPDAPNLILTNNTVDDGMVHAQSRGGVVCGSNPGAPLTINTRNVGMIVTRAAQYGVALYNPGPGNQTYDALAFDNGFGDYQTGSGMTYTHCDNDDPLFVDWDARDYHLQGGSPAIDYVLAARYGLHAPFDIDGNPFVTADAGCYAA
jgi:hypothetical protein